MAAQLMTEEDAKARICPFTLAGPIPELEGGRFPTGKLVHAPAMCQGKRCMAWTNVLTQTNQGFCARLQWGSTP